MQPWQYVLIIGIPLAILIVVVLCILIRRAKSKSPKISIDYDFISNIIASLGSNDNIKNIEVENQKLKVTVVDIKKVLLEEIKTLASSGVFVSGNNIKVLFKYDSDLLKQELSKYKGDVKNGKDI